MGGWLGGKPTDAGFRDGDPEWEALGIFEHITRPRITAAVTGRTSEGEPVNGEPEMQTVGGMRVLARWAETDFALLETR